MEKETFLKRAFKFLIKPWTLVILGVIVVIVLLVAFSGGKKAAADTVTVARGNISEEVSATGNVEPISSVDLAFVGTGRVTFVNAAVGDKVYAGEALVSLDKSNLQTQLTKAEADLASKNADLNKANVDLANYYGSIPDILNDAYAKSSDAVRKQLDGIFNNDESQNPSLTFTTDVSIDNDVRTLRVSATDALNQWSGDLGKINTITPQTELKNYLDKANGYLSTVRSLILRTLDAVVNAPSGSLSASSSDTYKANINTGLTNVNTAISNLTNQEQSIAAENAAIASLTAGIKSYQASIDNINAQLSQMTIYAPISGVVTVQNAKVGEIATAGAVMTSVISGSRFEVEADIAEADIAKLKVGDAAAITLDAYGNDVTFDAAVSSIDPAETMIEGVATYKTKFQFTKSDDRPKSGMTANITVFTDKRENVLVVPQRVVSTDKDGIKTVLMDIGNGQSEKRTIQTGLKGADGNIEVISGLSEGDRILVNNTF